MLDSTLRPVKDRLLTPIARTALGRVHPTVISTVGLVAGVAAAIAAWRSLAALAVVLWLSGRVADGLDGLVARSSGRASDVGGLLDFGFDTVGYAAVPLGLAFGIDERGAWIVTSVLLAAFYLNAATLGSVAALLEKRGFEAGASGRSTNTVMPRGLVEGTETIVFFTVALAFPNAATAIWWVMTVAVLVTAAERIRWAARILG